jgi:hypothetical protein
MVHCRYRKRMLLIEGRQRKKESKKERNKKRKKI